MTPRMSPLIFLAMVLTLGGTTTTLTPPMMTTVMPAGDSTTVQSTNVSATNMTSEDSKNDTMKTMYRLPGNLVPDLYFLDIKTFLKEDDFRFEGKVKIRFQCINDTSEVVLHSRGLNITESEVRVSGVDGAGEVGVVGHRYIVENSFYVVQLATPLTAGTAYFLEVPYVAALTAGLAGYYRSSYKDRATNTTRWMAVTQFEPTDARRAFPCFDEPAMKARFRISLTHEDRFSSISNMPLVKSVPAGSGWTKDEYQESVPMSTYLVAFVVSEMANLQKEGTENATTKFRVWARPDALEQAKYALDIAPKILSFFERYFEVPYPLPKMDMIAVPDFNSGAMENWGLVTYRETAMLFEEGVSPATSKESVTRVVAHELAHQWFGNLVTMRWWDDLWLNEGFATYVAALGTAHVQPEWHSQKDAALEQMLAVFSLDALQSSHPVSATIKHPSEISQIFDSISYSKGAFLLRMMSHFLGEATFRRGVTRYLRAHQFSNAEQDSLWESLEMQAREEESMTEKKSDMNTRGTVKEVMDSWTLQTGYPIVTVHRNYENNSASVSQSRFLTDWKGRSAESSASVWWVPLSFTNSKQRDFEDTKPKAWMYRNDTEITNISEAKDWLLFNIHATGLYRVNYDATNWGLLAEALRQKNYADIPTLNRAQLIDDSMDMARSGQLEYSSALEVLRYLQQERHYLPWRSALSNLAYFTRMTRRSGGYGSFRSFMQSLLSPVYAHLGKQPFRSPEKGESLPMTKHRAQLLAWSCSMGVGDCEERAAGIFSQWQHQREDPDQHNPVPVDLRSVIYCSAVRLGDQATWEFTWQRYLGSNVAAEKGKLLSALGCTKEVWMLHRFLDMSLDEASGIRKQDATSVFYSVARASTGFYVAKDFFTTRLHDIHKFLGPKASRLGRYFNAIAESMNTEAELIEMKRFSDENSDRLKDAKLSVKQALENIKLNVQWRSRYFESTVEWLKNHANATYFA